MTTYRDDRCSGCLEPEYLCTCTAVKSEPVDESDDFVAPPTSSSLKRSAALGATDLAAAMGRAKKKPRFSKVHFDLTADDSDGEPYEETSSQDFIESDSESSSDHEPVAPEEKKEDKQAAREPSGRGQRCKRWCITDYRPGASDKWKGHYDDGSVEFVVGQYEIAPETKREHFQCYVELKTPITTKTFIKRFGQVHAEYARGSAADNVKYCSKEESRKEGTVPIKLGEAPSTRVGKSSRQQDAVQVIMKGGTVEDVARDFPDVFVRLHKGLTSLADKIKEDRKDHEPVKALCLYGPPGGGKTWKAVDIAKKLCASGALKNGYLLRQNQEKWFDGLSGQQILIFNDFSGDSKELPFNQLLGLFDPFKQLVPVKGGFAKMTAKYLIFTSNKHPQDWYKDDPYNKGQLARRFGVGSQGDQPTGVAYMPTRQDQLDFVDSMGTVNWNACATVID